MPEKGLASKFKNLHHVVNAMHFLYSINSLVGSSDLTKRDSEYLTKVASENNIILQKSLGHLYSAAHFLWYREIKGPKKSLEIERKFLVNATPNLQNCKRVEIQQGYIVVGDNTEVRIRKKGDQYYETVKTGSGKVRKEIEVSISKETFEKLWPLTDERRIEKTRIEMPQQNGQIIELDVYGNKLSGLMVAEVEFKSNKDADEFEPPTWFGKEVTEDDRFKNKNLALYGFSK